MSRLINSISTKIEEIFSKNLQSKKLPKKLAVAVSGGADSLALTLLLNEFCLQKKIKLFAATVDHKMRKSSSSEAQALHKILKAKKISHEILTIKSKKTFEKNIEASLREIRFELLSEFCKKNKIEFLFLGHHVGDVAENFLIRLFRGSGLDGLSAIAEISEINGIKLLRPLLDFEKDELKSFLRQEKVQWFEDETNEDEKFLRNKIRKFLASFEDEKLIQKRIKKAADEISEIRDEFDNEMLAQAKEILALTPERNFLIDHKKFQKLDEKIALKILALILMEIGEKNYKPRFEKLKNFYSHLQNENVKQRNFYGCMVKKFDKKNLVIFPEKNRQVPPSSSFRTILRRIF